MNTKNVKTKETLDLAVLAEDSKSMSGFGTIYIAR